MSDTLTPYEQALVEFRDRLLHARVPEGHRLALMTAFRQVYELGRAEERAENDKTARGLAKTINIMTQHIDDVERGA